jgi:GGDEF domain-containing protein
VSSVQQARALAEKIRLRLCDPYLLTVAHEGAARKVVEHHCSVSIGLVVFQGDGDQDVVDLADTAMYQAKAAGRNAICVVTAGSLPQ